MKVEIKEYKPDPLITISQSEIENRTSGQQVAQIYVTRESDNQVQCYYVTMKINGRNRISCEVAVQDINRPQMRKKEVFGSWFKRLVLAVETGLGKKLSNGEDNE